MSDFSYRCPKCGCLHCDVNEMRATGEFWAKIFDVQNRRFTTVTCRNCTYTELYRVPSSQLGSVFDLFTG